jgi:hypothetical protein
MRQRRRISVLESKHSAVGYDTIACGGGHLFYPKEEDMPLTEQIGV